MQHPFSKAKILDFKLTCVLDLRMQLFKAGNCMGYPGEKRHHG